MIAITGVALIAIARGPHRVGDYFTETDFYGGYVTGARLIQHGHLEAARYGVVGPVYEIALALVGAATRDLFVAGEWISIGSAIAALALWFALLRRRTSVALAFATVAFLAANPTFFRYGYSVTTDMLAFALEAAALCALLAARRLPAAFLAGALSALAALTRYSAVVLLPGAIVRYAWLAPAPETSRRTALLLFLTGFGLIALPWLVFALHAGAPPGAQLFHDIAFDIYANARGHSWVDYQSHLQPGFRSLVGVLTRDPLAVVRREGSNLVSHLGADAKRLLGWPVAIACLAGIVVALAERSWRTLAPFAIFGALFYAALIPAFYSERYSLVLAPFYLIGVGVLATSPGLARRVRIGAIPLVPLLALILFAFSLFSNVAAQRATLDTVPAEVLPAARALRADAPPGASVMALKSQIAFYSGLEFAALPATSELHALADACRERHADYLYYSWLESNNRPSFWYLLDPAAAIPGLERLEYVHGHPAAIYRVGLKFGESPAWLADDGERKRSELRVIAETPPHWRWRTHLSLAVAALEQRHFGEALEHAGFVTQERPGEALAWRLLGDARLQTGDRPGAITAFERAVALEPAAADTRVVLGWLLLASGEENRAAEVWRPAAATTTNRAILARMVELFHARGDAEAEREARAALERSSR